MQEGFSIKVNENNVHFNGGVLLLLADTLAAHQIGGFKVGVSFALRKCHDCLKICQIRYMCKRYIHHQCHECFKILFFSFLRVILLFEILHHTIITAVC